MKEAVVPRDSRRILIAGASALLMLLHLGALAAAPGPRTAAFDATVAPVLARNCLECHSPSNAQGGLDLSTPDAARRGGKRGPAVAPGKPQESWLWKRVAAGEMPPGRALPASEKRVLQAWLANGAEWGTSPIDPFRYSSDRRAGYDWWSLQPVRMPAPPKVKLQGWALNPVDHFVLAKLEGAGLKPSPPADRRTLIRRLYFDLLGLPPTPEEVDAFIQDRQPQAYERLVDRLLASPHYGERWARHWLDVVRFGESQGFERNKLRPNAWKYRDWVVEALNSDLPYNEFVRLQLAGDVLRPDDPLAVIASGFLVVGPYDLTAYTAASPMMRAAAREEEVEGLIGTVAQTFLGLTANCARCHDHKFDPISQKEYYSLAAALGGTYHGAEREVLTPAGQAAAASAREALSTQITELKARLAGAPEPNRRQLTAQLGRLESRHRLLSGGPGHVTVPKDPGPVHVLARGDFRQKGETVLPGGIAAVSGIPAAWGLKQDTGEGDRRKALAEWITDPRNPLTPRVLVNRVWAHHLGAGLVGSANDFGFNGGRPSHPELLDWLAAAFVKDEGGRMKDEGALGWSLKRLHRLILTSATYRQSAQSPNPQSAIRNPQSADGENRLLWRQNRRRLDAEALRDAVLAVSGELDPKIGGPGFRDWSSESKGDNEVYTVTDAVKPEFNRRTLYRMVIRAGTSPFLDVLDCPDPSVSAPRRSVTTTPLQALSLLNNRFMEHCAGRWAERLQREAPGNLREQVSRAYRAAYTRPPAEREIRLGTQLAAAHGLGQFCLVLLNSNEFVYVD